MKAMVLAAGEGTRLRPLTLALPKPMVPIAGVPLLTRTLRMLGAQGVRDIAVNLYHRPEAIRQSLGDGSRLGVRLTYSDERTLMGTAGGVKRMERFLDETFLVLYGDNLYRFEVAPLVAFHRQKRALATIATFTATNPSACGLVGTDEAGSVTRFQEKPPPAEVFTDQANAGVYVLEPEVLAHIPPDTFFDFGKDVFPALLAARPGSVYARPLDGYLQDTGTVPAYRQANWDVIEGRVGPSEAAVSSDARVSPGASLVGGRNVLGPDVIIEDGARLEGCILWDGCRVGADASLTDAILGRGVRIGEGATIGAGAILADGASVGMGARVPEEARLGPGEEFRGT
jgi:NDP-sugar pyrophosphorylase family protein